MPEEDTESVDLNSLADRQLIMKTHTVCMQVMTVLAPNPVTQPNAKPGVIQVQVETVKRVNALEAKDKKHEEEMQRIATEAATAAAGEASLSAAEKWGAIGVGLTALGTALAAMFKGGN